MYTPEEPEYYLRRAFDTTDAVSGTPFIGEGGSLESDLFIIYGHNMDNGTMFGTLDRYQDAGYWRDHSVLTLTGAQGRQEYEIFAAVETRVLNTRESGFRYYQQSGDLSENAFQELLTWLTENALYDTGIKPEYGEQVVLLSTCSYHTENGRFLVAAKKVGSE